MKHFSGKLKTFLLRINQIFNPTVFLNYQLNLQLSEILMSKTHAFVDEDDDMMSSEVNSIPNQSNNINREESLN